MQYASDDLTPHERYKVLTAFVLPRPIAWVTSLGQGGVVNAAPFSFFNVFAEDPPLIMFAINKRPDGRLKDTVRPFGTDQISKRTMPGDAKPRIRIGFGVSLRKRMVCEPETVASSPSG